MRWIFSIITLCLLCNCTKAVEAKFLAIPALELKEIEKLFSYLFLEEGFAYVLFGNKPMARTSEIRGKHAAVELEALWKKWEEYAHLANIQDFLFFSEHDEKWFNVILVNKKECLRVIEQNLSLFHQKLDSHSTPAEILDRIVSSQDLFNKGVKKSHALIGILFGYGTENAIGFEKYQSNGPRAATEGSGTHNEENFEFPLFIPHFVSFSDKETHSLVNDYKRQRKEILEILTDENALWVCLSRLMEKRD